MKWLKRIFGISATPLPENDDGWTFEDGSIRLQLAQMPEIRHPGSAVRLEGKGLPVRVLVVHGQDGRFHALANRCTHMGRRIDILPGTDRIECCSVSKSTYDYSGQETPASIHRHIIRHGIDHRTGLVPTEWRKQELGLGNVSAQGCTKKYLD